MCRQTIANFVPAKALPAVLAELRPPVPLKGAQVLSKAEIAVAGNGRFR
jgi:hypothetical protein